MEIIFMVIKGLPAKPRKGRKIAVPAPRKSNIPGVKQGFIPFNKPTNKQELMAMLKAAVENTK